MNDYFTFFYVKHFELPMCMKCAIQINLPCLALPCLALDETTVNQDTESKTLCGFVSCTCADFCVHVKALAKPLNGLCVYTKC